MINVSCNQDKLILGLETVSEKQAFYYKGLIRKIPGYEQISQHHYTAPIIELKSVVDILKDNINYESSIEQIKFNYNKYVKLFKSNLIKYNSVSVIKSLNINNKYDFLKISPRVFQKLAIEWVSVKKGAAQVYGGIIADEVGLGKTCESIAGVCNLKKRGIVNKGIVITLANLKNQWADEIIKFCNESYTIIERSSKKKREKLYKEFNSTFLIINYELYIRDAEMIQTLKKENPNLDFSFIIIDEAQKMKEANKVTYKKINLLQPKVKILLTATPIKKDVKDLFALFNYLDESILMGWNYFKNKFLVFKKKFGKQIPSGGRKEYYPFLHYLIAPYMLRRKSTDVSSDIPKVNEIFIPIELTKEQQRWIKILEFAMNKAVENAKAALEENNEKAVELNENIYRARFKALATCSNHMKLLELSESKSMKRLVEKLKIKDYSSPKLDLLLDYTENIILGNDNNDFFSMFNKNNKKEKLVIFTQSERMTGIMEEAIYNKFKELDLMDKINIMKFTGKMPKKCNKILKDHESVDCFNCKYSNECHSTEKSKFMFVHDPSVNILICTDAAYAGLNLQVARFMINYDIPYDPGTLEQRWGRIKRIGSEYDTVYVFNFYSKDSLDESTVQILKNRREGIDEVVENKKSENECLRDLSGFREQTI